MREKVYQLVGDLAGVGRGEDTVLFGPGGKLDSLGLVNLLADIEMAVSEEFGCEIVLASEKAMSRERSPFRTVETLAEFTAELVEEALGVHHYRGTK